MEDLVPVLLGRSILIRYHDIVLAGPLQKQVCVTHLEHEIGGALPTKIDLRTISRRGRFGHSFRTLQFVQTCGVPKRLSREGPVRSASRTLTMCFVDPLIPSHQEMQGCPFGAICAPNDPRIGVAWPLQPHIKPLWPSCCWCALRYFPSSSSTGCHAHGIIEYDCIYNVTKVARQREQGRLHRRTNLRGRQPY